MKRALIICDDGDSGPIDSEDSVAIGIGTAGCKFDIVISISEFYAHPVLGEDMAQCLMYCDHDNKAPRSAFMGDDGSSTDLTGLLADLGVVEVYVCGKAHDNFLLDSADDSNSFFKTFIVRDACQGIDEEGMEYLSLTGCGVINSMDIPKKSAPIELDIEDELSGDVAAS